MYNGPDRIRHNARLLEAGGGIGLVQTQKMRRIGVDDALMVTS